MKILRIGISNIASLDGTHAVDFTAEPLRSAGLFSISGATGSGKSSLLDAMCLALYDRTPRLQGVGRLEDMNSGEKQSDPRSLLRRGCAEGAAEVTFEGVDGNLWTARWSVRRARKKADGKLQNVDMSLLRHQSPADLEGTLHVGGKKTEVLAAIQERIGLTFEQFTRAVLLAQNDFATFLKADDKDRAEILQALTGTEQFEAISKAVYERQSTEKKALENLQARLQGAEPLSVEDRAAAETELKDITEKLEQQRRLIKQLEAHQEWFRLHQERQDNLAKTRLQLEAIRQQNIQAAPRQRELKHTEIVQREARTLCDRLKATTDALADALKKQQAADENFAASEVTVKALAEKKEAADRAVKSGQQNMTDLQPQLREARVLDAKLEPAQAEASKALKSFELATGAVEKASTALAELEGRRRSLTAEHATLQRELAELNHVATFANAVDLWQERLQSLAKARQSLEAATAEAARAERDCGAINDRVAQLAAESASYITASESAKAAADQAALAADRFDAEQLASERGALTAKKAAFSELKHHLETVNDQRSRADKLSARIAELQQLAETNAQTLKLLRENELPAAKAEWQGMVRQFRAIQAAIQDDAVRLRTELQDDQPCPVCGSVQHPYHDQDLSSQNVAVKAAEESVAQAEDILQKLQRREANLESAMASYHADIKDRAQELHQLELQLASGSFAFSDDPNISEILKRPADEQLSMVQIQLPLIDEDLKQIAKNETAQRKAASQLQKASTALQSARDAEANHQKQLEALRTNLKVAQTTAQNAAAAVDAAKIVVENASLPLQPLWAALPEGVAEFQASPNDFIDAFVDQATQCYDKRNRQQKLISDQKQLEASIKPQQESLATLRETATMAKAEYSRLADAAKAVFDQRQKLFEGQSADDVEQKQQQVLENATTALDQVSSQLNDAREQLSAAKKEQSSVAKLTEDLQNQNVAVRKSLDDWLKQFEQTHQRTLSTVELEVLLGRDNQWLADEQAALEKLQTDLKTVEGAIQELSRQLEEFEATRPTEQTVPEISEALAIATEAAKTIEEDRDQISGRLRADDVQKSTNAELSKQIQSTQTAIEPWLKLNELIGSADGAKFRSIAQRQTLDILLSYANVHLQQLSNRYRLERLPECLNLIIVDLHMAEERRSVFSLSGGESFLVSLALALGLASLTSNRLRIESLFIDEGFGSLDPETLGIAMSALMHLEAQGRKVGVISHVTEMTEAIPVQIKVVKASNGASKLVVPHGAQDKRPGASASGL